MCFSTGKTERRHHGQVKTHRKPDELKTHLLAGMCPPWLPSFHRLVVIPLIMGFSLQAEGAAARNQPKQKLALTKQNMLIGVLEGGCLARGLFVFTGKRENHGTTRSNFQYCPLSKYNKNPVFRGTTKTTETTKNTR